jgi:curved DNA-binding protein CbpA
MARREAFDALGLDGDASQEQIKTAYRDRVKEVHPDSGGDEESFKRVNRAYETLTEE